MDSTTTLTRVVAVWDLLVVIADGVGVVVGCCGTGCICIDDGGGGGSKGGGVGDSGSANIASSDGYS